MTKDEKIYLIQCLLVDIRGNWADNTVRRARKAKELCNEIEDEGFDTLAKECQKYIALCKKEGCNIDGRYFRDTFPNGYENMENLYDLPHTLFDKSEEFQKIVRNYITYPDMCFEDVD